MFAPRGYISKHRMRMRHTCFLSAVGCGHHARCLGLIVLETVCGVWTRRGEGVRDDWEETGHGRGKLRSNDGRTPYGRGRLP